MLYESFDFHILTNHTENYNHIIDNNQVNIIHWHKFNALAVVELFSEWQQSIKCCLVYVYWEKITKASVNGVNHSHKIVVS